MPIMARLQVHKLGTFAALLALASVYIPAEPHAEAPYRTQKGTLIETPLLWATQQSDRAANERTCTERITGFVKELDALLDGNPPSVYPLYDLLKRYFPVEQCNIPEIIGIARRSKYFSGAGEQPTSYVISFNSAAFFPTRGFHVSFALLKEGGNSQLPFASVNK